jgi:hypothetical protein
MRWAGHIANMEVISSYKLLVGILKGRYHVGNQGVDWRVILKWILNK